MLRDGPNKDQKRLGHITPLPTIIRNIAMISPCRPAMIQYFLSFVNANTRFRITRKATRGIENKNTIMPGPGPQEPLGEIFSSMTIAVMVTA